MTLSQASTRAACSLVFSNCLDVEERERERGKYGVRFSDTLSFVVAMASVLSCRPFPTGVAMLVAAFHNSSHCPSFIFPSPLLLLTVLPLSLCRLCICLDLRIVEAVSFFSKCSV